MCEHLNRNNSLNQSSGGQIFAVTRSKNSAYCWVHHFKVFHFHRLFSLPRIKMVLKRCKAHNFWSFKSNTSLIIFIDLYPLCIISWCSCVCSLFFTFVRPPTRLPQNDFEWSLSYDPEGFGFAIAYWSIFETWRKRHAICGCLQVMTRSLLMK